MGIRNLSIFNKALLGSGARDLLWKSIINLKYGIVEGAGFLLYVKGCHGVGLWKEISKEGMLLKQHCSVKLGDGFKARF